LPGSMPTRQISTLLELKTLQCREQTHQRQRKSWQFLLIKRVQASTHSSWADTWAQHGRQWLLLISLTQLYLPLAWDFSRSKVPNLSDWLKVLGDGLGHIVWPAIFLGNGAVQESGRRNRNPLNNPSHLRWQHEKV
jgi:hypothetical protein